MLSQERMDFPSRRRSTLEKYGGGSLSLQGVGGGSVRRATLRETYHNAASYGPSKFSLTRMSKSSSTSLRQMVLSHSACDRRSSSSSSSTTMQNAEWEFGERRGDVSKPPSLAGSDASSSSSSSSVEWNLADSADPSRSSSLGSTEQPPPSPSAALRRFYALHRQQQQQGHPTADRRRGKEHDAGTWGQFVDVADAEEDLVRMSKFLSIRRVATPPRPFTLPCEF